MHASNEYCCAILNMFAVYPIFSPWLSLWFSVPKLFSAHDGFTKKDDPVCLFSGSLLVKLHQHYSHMNNSHTLTHKAGFHIRSRQSNRNRQSNSNMVVCQTSKERLYSLGAISPAGAVTQRLPW